MGNITDIDSLSLRGSDFRGKVQGDNPRLAPTIRYSNVRILCRETEASISFRAWLKDPAVSDEYAPNCLFILNVEGVFPAIEGITWKLKQETIIRFDLYGEDEWSDSKVVFRFKPGVDSYTLQEAVEWLLFHLNVTMIQY